MKYIRKMIVLPSRKNSHISPRRKKKSSKKKDTSYVEYKHYADFKPVSAKIAPVDKKTKKALKKLRYSSSFKKK